MSPALARVIWHRLETLNAVTYFCRECRDARAEAAAAALRRLLSDHTPERLAQRVLPVLHAAAS